MTLKGFIKKYKGVKDVGNTPKNKGQCTGLVMVYIQELKLSHIWGHARDIFKNAPSNEYEKIENSPDIYPDEGDIICWNSTMGLGFGHIAIVVSSDPEKDTVEVFEQNNPYGKSPRIYTYSNWRGIIGWLKPFVLEDFENDPPGLSLTIDKLEKRIQGLLETKDLIQSKLEASRANEEILVKKLNELDKKYIELSKKYVDEIGELADQRDRCQKDYSELYVNYEEETKVYFETIQDLKKRIIKLEKLEVNEDMNKITAFYESMPKTLKVFCFIALSTILSELAIELVNLDQTFLVRISAQVINLILVAVEQGAPVVKARLKK